MSVHVVEVFTTQQVVHRLIVHAIGVAQLYAGIELAVLISIPGEIAAQRRGEMVIVTCLYPIDGIALRLVQLLVCKVQLVKIYLTCLRTALPVLLGRIVGIQIVVAALRSTPHVIVVGWEALPIVGRRISAAVVQLGAAVQLITHHGAGCQLHPVVYLPIPCKHHCGSKVIHHSTGALLATLIPPVGVVQAVVGQPVCLVRAGTLLGTLRRIAPGGEVQRMAVVPLLLQGQHVGQAVIERTVNGGRLHVAPSVGQRTIESPSVFAQAGAMGKYATQGVVAVQAAQRHLAAHAHAGGTKVIVGGTAKSGHKEGIALKRVGSILVLGSIVHAAYVGVLEASVLHLIGLHAVDVHIVVLVVQGAELKPRRTPRPADIAGVEIAGRPHLYDVGRHVVVLAKLRLRDGEITGVVNHDGRVLLRLHNALRMHTQRCRQGESHQLKLFLHRSAIVK